jgi:hypothetical protein
MQLLVPRLIASFVLVLQFGLFTPQQTQAAFFTPGQFDVGPSGAASYTVPIAVPPGTGGMAPSLALAYNSQGGNGLLGMGWNLSGLSAITRCPKSLVQDGVKEGINYDSADKYCLDGQRLVAISGTYGANATEYRTEGESYSRIISYGSNGYGPVRFKVWTKSGQIIEFGNTADSAIEAQGKVAIRVWAVNKVSDTKGNYLTVTYTEDNPNGQYYPSHIDYTGNANAGLAPYNSVQFVYATRPDITPMYYGGSLIKNTVRLSNVQTHAQVNGADTVVKDYRLSYDMSVATQRSRITQIQECDGTGGVTCLSPTTFTSAHADADTFGPSYINNPLVGSGWNTPGNFTYADVNGDGSADLVYTGSSAVQVVLSNGDGTFRSNYINNPLNGAVWNSPGNFGYFDTNSDGCADLVYTGTSFVQVVLSKCDGSFGPNYINNPVVGSGWNTPGNFTYADVNGDGSPDLVYTGSSVVQVVLSNGDGTFRSNYINNPLNGAGWNFPGNFRYFDTNSDGCADLVYTGSSFVQVVLSKCDGSFGPNYINNPLVGSGWNTPGNFTYADVNGDGRPDLVYTGSSVAQAVLSKQYDNLGSTTIDTTIQGLRMTSIRSGLGATTAITYKPLTDASVYTKEATGVYPVVDVQAPMYVVSQVSSSNGVGGNYVSNYSYVGAKSHLSGGGFLGFRQTISTDAQTGIVSTTTYRQDYPYQGLPLTAEKRTAGGVLLNSVANTWTAATNPAWSSQYHAPQLGQSVESSYELNGGLISLVTTATTYDAYGNPTSIKVSTPDGYSKTTTNTYINDTVNWYLGRLSNAAVVSATP